MKLTAGYGPARPEIWYALDVDPDTRHRQHGKGTYRVGTGLVAGEFTRVEFEFLLGDDGLPEGGDLGIAWRWPYDWSALQSDDPEAAGYVTVEIATTAQGEHSAKAEVAAATLVPRYVAYGGIEPFHHYLALRATGAALLPGTRVRVVCGDDSAGGPGWRTPTCQVEAADFLMLSSASGDQRWTHLLGAETFCVAPGPPAQLVLVGPSDAVCGEPARYVARVEDIWGNPTATETLPELTLPAGATVVETTQVERPPVWHVHVRFDSAGTFQIAAHLPALADDQDGRTRVLSNAVRVHPEAPQRMIYWGDLHAGQSLIGCGAGTLDDHYAFGRDAAGLTFITHQANDHYVTTEEWSHTRERTEAFYEPGRYVPFLGCEWSPPTRDGGDRNVYYLRDEPRLRRSDRFFTEPVPDPEPDIPTAPEFHDAFRDEDVLVNIHVGGRMTNLEWYEPRIERLAELHSTHGTVEWFFRDCLARGFHVAATAGTDGVMGRPGACRPGSRLVRNVPNGLTAVYAEALTREALWEALQNRRTYATTGQRIVLDVSVDGHPMGAAYETDDPRLVKLSVLGTAAIETVEVIRGLETIHTWTVAELQAPQDDLWSIRLMFSGTAERGTARKQRFVWDGTLEVEDGRLQSAAGIDLETPLDEVRIESENVLSWKALTAGNDTGSLIEIRGDGSTTCRVMTPGCQFSFSLDQIADAPLVVPAGGDDCAATVSLAPADDGPRQVEFDYRDQTPLAGEAAYWIKVVQVDRGKAWSSPVYVRRP